MLVSWHFRLSLFPPGVVRQVKPLIGPLTTVLKLSMRNLSNQGESGQNIINVHVYVSEFWFWKEEDFFSDTVLAGPVFSTLQSVSDFNVVTDSWHFLS